MRSTGTPGEFERRLVRLGPGIAEEHPAGLPELVEQPFGQFDDALVDVEVRHMAECSELVRDGVDDRGMGMSERVHGDSAEEVEVAVTVGIPHVRTRATLEGERGGAVVVHQRGRPPLLPGCGHEVVAFGSEVSG